MKATQRTLSAFKHAVAETMFQAACEAVDDAATETVKDICGTLQMDGVLRLWLANTDRGHRYISLASLIAECCDLSEVEPDLIPVRREEMQSLARRLHKLADKLNRASKIEVNG